MCEIRTYTQIKNVRRSARTNSVRKGSLKIALAEAPARMSEKAKCIYVKKVLAKRRDKIFEKIHVLAK